MSAVDVAPLFVSRAGAGIPSHTCFSRTANLLPLGRKHARITVPMIVFGKPVAARTTVTAASLKEERASVTEESETPVRIIALVGDGSVSPLKSVPWRDVMIHTAQRLKLVDEHYEMLVFNDNFYQSNDENVKHVTEEVRRANILVVIAVMNGETVKWIQENVHFVQNVICFESSATLINKLGGLTIEVENNTFRRLAQISQWKKLEESREVAQTVSSAWERSLPSIFSWTKWNRTLQNPLVPQFGGAAVEDFIKFSSAVVNILTFHVQCQDRGSPDLFPEDPTNIAYLYDVL